jgi:hypothetical protein
MATTHLPPDFKEFLKLLNAHQVEYLLMKVNKKTRGSKATRHKILEKD